MLAGTPFQRVRAFERIRPENLHLPPVTSLRADDQYLPLPWPIRKDVFDTSDHVSLQLEIARIVHLDFHCHTPKVYDSCLGRAVVVGLVQIYAN